MGQIKFAIAVAVVVLLSACGLPIEQEMARVTSPDGEIDAVVIRTNYGATTNYNFLVYLVPNGRVVAERRGWRAIKSARVATIPAALRESSLTSDRYAEAWGVNVRWQAMDHVVIEYSRADRYDPVRSKPTLLVAGRTVHIELLSGVEFPSLLNSGGRLTNRNGARQETKPRD